MLRRINIKNRVLRGVLYTGSALRIKHYRGHGIHSPFVYSMIRLAFMKHCLTSLNTSLYQELREARCSKRVARQLQNVLNYCRYKDYSLLKTYCVTNTQIADKQLLVVMHTVNIEATQWLIGQAKNANIAVAVIYPRNSRARFKVCRHEIESGNYLSIDNRRFMLFFSEEHLPTQHFKL